MPLIPKLSGLLGLSFDMSVSWIIRSHSAKETADEFAW